MSKSLSTLSLNDKVALVTGATRGIGRAVSLQLGSLGATVLVAGRHIAATEALADELRRDGYEAHALALDVVREEERLAAVAFIERTFGRLDILINNAAVWLESDNAAQAPHAPPSRTTSQVLRETFETNFFGPIFLTQALLPLIRRSTSPRIVNVSSIRGSVTLNADASSPVYPNKALAYDTSKSALNAFTVQLAEELRSSGIKVNAVHPGWVRTAMGGAVAHLGVEEGASAVVAYATIGEDGPTGGFFFNEERLPW